MVQFRTVEEALSVLGEASNDTRTREVADQFLQHIDSQEEIPALVEALRSEHFNCPRGDIASASGFAGFCC